MSILPPIHPGEILREDYLRPAGMSAGKLAARLGVPRTRIERIVDETGSISPNTALRLARYYRTTPEYWLNLQASFDLKVEAAAIAEDLARIEAPAQP